MFRLAVLTTLVAPAFAHAADPATVIASVEKRYATVESIQADFTQVTTSELYGSSTTKGSMVLQRPSKMRWDFEDGKQYVTDGATMWIKNPAEKQVMQMTDIGAATSSADSLLQSLDKVSEIFVVEVLEDTASTKRLKLVPKQGSDTLKEIELALDGDLVLQKVGILDAFESRTELTFQGVKLGADVKAGTFTFQVPEGYELLKN